MYIACLISETNEYFDNFAQIFYHHQLHGCNKHVRVKTDWHMESFCHCYSRIKEEGGKKELKHTKDTALRTLHTITYDEIVISVLVFTSITQKLIFT